MPRVPSGFPWSSSLLQRHGRRRVWALGTVRARALTQGTPTLAGTKPPSRGVSSAPASAGLAGESGGGGVTAPPLPERTEPAPVGPAAKALPSEV